MEDTADLESVAYACGFKSHRPYIFSLYYLLYSCSFLRRRNACVYDNARVYGIFLIM